MKCVRAFAGGFGFFYCIRREQLVRSVPKSERDEGQLAVECNKSLLQCASPNLTIITRQLVTKFLESAEPLVMLRTALPSSTQGRIHVFPGEVRSSACERLERPTGHSLRGLNLPPGLADPLPAAHETCKEYVGTSGTTTHPYIRPWVHR